jgi:hypothetical protein
MVYCGVGILLTLCKCCVFCCLVVAVLQRHLGGFTVPSGGDEEYTPAIILYENNITDKDELEKTLQHELVSEYDDDDSDAYAAAADDDDGH